ncbi:MAG: class I SAM-dependent methyltransferase [bacterium]|nr:class I SAM-dependent methyltransferase [bacterium]
MEPKIDPKQLIQELTVEELCRSAEEFYRSQSDPQHHLTRPFGNTFDAPQILHRMGLVLHGLQLGKSMIVLDFGAGTCWFSRFLNQMQCATISVDASQAALELGQKSFEMWPVLGGSVQSPQFKPFDGYHLDVPSESVDRVICFDAFHHVPNQHQVLSEFHRVLKPGGVVGFSEPGPHHSQSDLSQQEMRNHKVLENDIRLDEIHQLADDIGFTDLRVMLLTDPNQLLSYQDYRAIVDMPQMPLAKMIIRMWHSFREVARWLSQPEPSKPDNPERAFTSLPAKMVQCIVPAMIDSTVFFLAKGTSTPDSRSHEGLKHEMEILSAPQAFQVGKNAEIRVQVRNTGHAVWLHENIGDIGVVKVAAHLLDTNYRLLNNDFARGRFGASIGPGQDSEGTLNVTFAEPGDYYLALDLVSERVTWFEPLGSKPQYLQVTVTATRKAETRRLSA